MNPINLKYLPGYLKKLKEKNQFDENLVVDIGTITNSNPYNTHKAFLFFLILFFLTLGSLTTLKLIFPAENITIVLNTSDLTSKDVSEILIGNGAEVLSIEGSENVYKVKLEKISNLKEFIEKLKNNKNFKKVELTK